MKLLGIDYGSKRIGIAITDELCMTANAVTTIYRNGTVEYSQISDIVKKNGITAIVVGLPVQTDGQLGQAAAKVQEFTEKLKTCLPENISIEFQDEQYTSKEVDSELRKFSVSVKKRKEKIDQLSARYILEMYIERNKPIK